MLNGRELRRHFAAFNERYFANRLPRYSIRVVPRITWQSELGRIHRKCRLIEILRWEGQPDEFFIGVLLHEMVHAATNDGHGPKWRQEMVRLRVAGAPLLAIHGTPDEDWPDLIRRMKLERPRNR